MSQETELKYTKNNGALINHDEQAFLLAKQRRKKQNSTVELHNTIQLQNQKIIELETRLSIVENLIKNIFNNKLFI